VPSVEEMMRFLSEKAKGEESSSSSSLESLEEKNERQNQNLVRLKTCKTLEDAAKLLSDGLPMTSLAPGFVNEELGILATRPVPSSRGVKPVRQEIVVLCDAMESRRSNAYLPWKRGHVRKFNFLNGSNVPDSSAVCLLSGCFKVVSIPPP
jgi:hypothetical protein